MEIFLLKLMKFLFFNFYFLVFVNRSSDNNIVYNHTPNILTRIRNLKINNYYIEKNLGFF